MESNEISTRLALIERALQYALRREIHLQAEVFAHRTFLIEIAKMSPPARLEAGQVERSLELLIQEHRQSLWVQLENTNPGLAAWLSKDEPPFV